LEAPFRLRAVTLARDVPGEAFAPAWAAMVSLSITKTYRRSGVFSGTGRRLCDLHHMAGGVAVVRIDPTGHWFVVRDGSAVIQLCRCQ
jgi:hypothetical protein